MRCPYCGGINTDNTSFCTYCGRDLKTPPPASRQGTTNQPSQRAIPQGYPAQPQPPTQQARQAPPPAQPRPGAAQPQRPAPGSPATSQQPQQARARQSVFEPGRPVTPPVPEAPAPFPPRTFAEMQALLPGAQEATVLETTTGDGHKKIVRISYARVTPWQQVATLLKVFKEQRENEFEAIIIQGFTAQDPAAYGFTNGQLRFDRNVRLGGQIINRYQVETGNGFESDSVRIVLAE